MNPQLICGWIHKRFAARLATRRAVPKDRLPIISFTFDDFPRSALMIGGELLEQKGACATYYTSLGLAGQETSVGRIFTFEDLRSAIAHGHELACHTHSHLSAAEHSADVIVRSCAENRRRALELLPDTALRNFSYPFGDVTLPVKRQVGDEYDSCRTVERGINAGQVDMAFLRGNPVYNGQPLACSRELIKQNTEVKGWLIFYTHDVCESPSRYGCTPEYFREVVSCAVGSGARVMRVKDAVEHFAVVRSS